jgi:hypothetical protein
MNDICSYGQRFGVFVNHFVGFLFFHTDFKRYLGCSLGIESCAMKLLMTKPHYVYSPRFSASNRNVVTARGHHPSFE